MDFALNEEQRMLREASQRFCQRELTREYVRWLDENKDYPPDELWKKIADFGLFRSNIPAEYGGQGLGMLDLVIAFEPICKASSSVALAVGTSLGFGNRFLSVLGTEAQKMEYLPRLGDGRIKTCMALTEPAGGTDILGALSTFAEDGGDRWVLNGQKVFITGAHVADYLITICKTERDQKPSRSLSVLLVPSDTPGITIRKIPKMSCKACAAAEIFFEDVAVPRENLLGTRGNGWNELLDVLNPERVVVSAMGVGLMEAVYEEACAYALQRQAFGGPIARFQILQHYLADMCVNLENARNLTYKAAWLCDQGRPYHMEATMAKLVSAQGAWHAVTYGAEILGGYGICNEFPMQRYLRDAAQGAFSPISNEMSKNMLMQFQGFPKSWV
ncbi:MAG: acyl-CoA/acyl-ACP dehydrogenase [Proteobacteria bacterium]|nr:acyl-CoA/acyl-ACP dehydrogenase [Pseudomonadota bacterium]